VRIAYRLTLALGTAAALVIAGAGLHQLRVEEEELQGFAMTQTTLLAESIRLGFAHALREHKESDVAELVHALSRVRPHVNMLVFDRAGHLVESSSDAEPTPEIARLRARARGQRDPVVDLVSTPTVPVLRVAVALEPAIHDSGATLVVERPLVEMQHALADARRTTMVAIVSAILLTALGLVVLTRIYVGRPLEGLIEHMQRLRAGDWSASPGEATSQDEVGAALMEFDALTEELKRTQAKLEDEAESRRRIQRTLEQVDKLATLGQLSAVVAHEVGSPLQILEGRARALIKNPHDPEATRRTSEIALEQVGRITRIVSQLLAMTRRRPPARRQIDPVVPVQAVLDLLDLEARRRSITLSLVEDEVPRQVLLDADQLQQVVLNLVRNALDAVSSGGMVTVRLARGALQHAEGSAPTPTFRLSVTDDGQGIADEERGQVFEPFFTTRAEGGGTGLGLAVVKSIVEEYRGRVDFSSSPGHRTEFVVDFPLTTQPPPSSDEPESVKDDPA
jgi:signal transduction histidine kinase